MGRPLAALFVVLTTLLSACSAPRGRWQPTHGLRAQTAAAHGGPGRARAGLEGEDEAEGEAEVHIPLWPLVEWSVEADGSNHVTALFPLYGSVTSPEGEIESIHVLTYFHGEDHTVFFPLYYKLGEEGSADKGVVPFAFWGPGYGIFPLVLSFWVRGEDGSESTWITPFYHSSTGPEGELEGRHLLTYFQTADGWFLFPLAYSSGEGDEHHFGIVPIWFQGPDYKVLFPLGFTHERPEGTDFGVFPLYFGGPDWWFLPFALTGAWDGEPGERTTWVTPLFHYTSREDGPDSFHFLTYFQGPDYKVFFPLAYSFGPEGEQSRGVIPFWFGNSDGWLAPLLLSGSWSEGEGERTTWITPLYHTTSREQGTDSFHFLTYFQGLDYKVLFPFGYSMGPEGDKSRGIFPLWFDDPDFWIIPPLLSARWSGTEGEVSTWVTPFFHYTDRDEGDDSFHFLTYLQGPDYQVLFPLAYRTGPEGERSGGIVPLYFGGPDWWFVPPLLSAGWKTSQGQDTLWITPLFHKTEGGGEDEDGAGSFHLLNYFQGPDYKVFFPLAYSLGPAGEKRRGILPFYMDGPGWAASPVLLSMWSEEEDGAESLWATPLYHHRYGPDGELHSRHVLNYFQSEDLTTLFPLYWDWKTEAGDERTLIVPLYWQSESAEGDFIASFVPPLFTYRRARELNTSLLYQAIPFSYQGAGDDWEFNFLWRLFHRRVEDGLSTTVVGPLWYSETRAGLPMDYKILGGLFARDVFETRGTYRNRYLWFLTMDEQPIIDGVQGSAPNWIDLPARQWRGAGS
jgi:hypothetical protein